MGPRLSISDRPTRVAATGDLHVRLAAPQGLYASMARLRDQADFLLVVGDLTESGRLVEAEAAADVLVTAELPVIAVLGNHDLRSLRRTAFRRALERAGVQVLDGQSTSFRLPGGLRVGIAGTTGSGGGFWPLEGPDAVHVRTLKRLALRARHECHLLEQALSALDADVRIAMTHFAPTATTLGREPPAKYWMLGNCELGQVLDRWQPDFAFHGHAHLGNLRGATPGGVPVRNVALPVVGSMHVEVLRSAPRCALPLEQSSARFLAQ
jgi:Icc-related predicted phosphoesterase